MAHLAVFLKILAIPFGLAGLILLFQNYHKHHYQYLRIYGYLVGLVIFNEIMAMALFYIFANLAPRFSSPTALIVETIYCFLTSLARIFICYLFLLLYQYLSQNKPPNKYHKLFGIIAGLLLAIILFFSFHSLLMADVLPISTISVFIILLSNWFNIGVLIVLFRRIPELKDKGKNKAIRQFSGVILMPYVLAMLIFVFHLLDLCTNEVFVIFYFIFHLVLFGFPIFYLKPFMKMYHGSIELVDTDREKQFIKLLEKYKISRREQEVLQLICQGKTNKQIEKSLFISLQTVKDHVYNIYRKTGVKNRVQLNNLFRFPGSQPFSINQKEETTK